MAHVTSLLVALALGITVVQCLQRIALRWTRHRRAKAAGCKPALTLPSRRWYFGIDIVLQMIRSYEEGSRNLELHEKFAEYGPTFRTEPTGTARIFTIDPENLKCVLGGKKENWGVEPVRYEAFRPFVAGGVLITDGMRWKHSREIAQSLIDRMLRHYSSDLTTFDHNIKRLLDRIPRDGSTVDLQPLLYQYTIDNSTENIFGDRVGALLPGEAGDYGRDFLECFIYCLKMAGERDEVPQWTYFVLDRKFRRSCRVIHDFADRNLRRALQKWTEEEKRGSPAADWAKSVTDFAEARDQVLNIIAASFDTIAILLTNAFFHLSRNPQCYKKLREEVMNFEEIPDANNIKKLEYLHFVIMEILRLNGPASFNSRVALQDNIIPRGGGPDGSEPVFVPKGDLIVVSMFSLQRQADVYGLEPDCFRPERWSTIKPKYWNWLPFSGGSRTCPGERFAMLHGTYLLFSLVREIERVENRDPELEFVEEYRVATGSKNGAKVGLWA